ncbi:LexA family transcriptional regulator [Pseudoflavonifractor sp. An85]|uniref:LexA family protein n=1 Tax=Pseudoflavonifractor sp. An85 TaxID=1965661 RepID=UPI0013023571|nr:LexA family transcriptional regulator [Pseudoflavonifractor sp. An85]
MARFNDRLKLLRRESGLSQQDFANQIGTSKSSVNMYERGEREPGIEMLEAIADYFNVDMDYLLGKSEHRNKSAWMEKMSSQPFADDFPNDYIANNFSPVLVKQFPLLGNIACGEPIFAENHFEAYMGAGENVKADFCLRAKGDSMIGARIQDGDIVFIRKQEIVNNGEIAAVLIGDEAMLKRVYYDKENGILMLFSENPMYETKRFSGEELNNIRILGKAVAFQGDIK